MKEPILLYEKDCRDVSVCKTLLEAESSIEPPDVDLYEVFDADGLVIHVRLEGKVAGFFGNPGTVKLETSEVKDSERLRTLILAYLRVLEVNDCPDGSDLTNLVNRLDETLKKPSKPWKLF
ncbi:MAG: hypothetical protein K2X81_02435 [Candidatus Obscuribacterales bacterium]|nr:hypothetical protein [Candidatus Obscuribacterales bacterium]